MNKIYLADRECEVSASEALQEIDKQYLGWGWNTEQTTLDLAEYAKDLERQLAEARESSIKVSKYLKGFCEKRICVDGIYFGFVDGSWLKANDQLLAKQRYELGLKEKGDERSIKGMD
jgi:hypothetical protein